MSNASNWGGKEYSRIAGDNYNKYIKLGVNGVGVFV